MRRESDGFTLIELLVVIAIIAILAAILFPVFARARENARKSSCQSNMKQLGIGFSMYVQDYDERFPAVRQGPGGWSYNIQPYVKDWDVFVCPSVSMAVRTCGPITSHGNAALVGEPWFGVPEGGYMMCAWEGAACCGYPKLASFQYPASTYLLVEGNCMGAFWGAFVKDGAPYAHHVYRHMDGLNICYVDGHVKWVKKTDPIYQALDNATLDLTRPGY